MELRSHGDYEIVMRGETTIVRVTGMWNIEKVDAVVVECKELLVKNTIKWILICDFRDWEGCTRDAAERMLTLVAGLSHAGLIAYSAVFSNATLQCIMEEFLHKLTIPTRICKNLSESLEFANKQIQRNKYLGDPRYQGYV